MHMRPVGETVALIERAGLEVRDVHALREHYVRTVDAWYRTFEDNWDRVVEMVGEEVARVWRLYLVGGALAFEEGRMGVDQILMVQPDRRRAQPAALVRTRERPVTDFPFGAFAGSLPASVGAVVVVLGAHLPGRPAGRPARGRGRGLGPRLRGDRGRGVRRLRGGGRRRPGAGWPW